MGRQIKGLLYFFITDIRYSFLIFWSILLTILLISITIGFFLINIEDGAMYFSLSFAIYIYCGILGFLTVKECIPFSIKMGATRKNLFISLGIFFLGLAIVKAILANTIQTVITSATKGLGIDTFSFMHLSQFLTNNWLTRVIIDTTVMFFFLALMFIIGLLFYKYGLLGGGSWIGVIVITLMIGIATGWITDLAIDIFKSVDLTFFYQILLIGILIYGISWLVIRKITIVKVK